MQQTCILVLGMHRSGTSALTGVLSILDVYLGSELLKPQSDNVKGFYENQKIVDINEKIFMHIGTYWHDLFYNEKKLDLVDKDIKEELEKVLIEEFRFSNIFAIKDPRLIYLFPLYKNVLKELNIDIKIILPYRNPIEVANSLHKRNGFSMEKGMLLWVYHFLLSEQHSREYKRVFISFDELIETPKETVKKISEILELDLLSKYEKNQKYIEDFLEPSLKHNNISIDNISPNTPKIVRNILALEEEFSDKNLYKEFDNLKEELFDYQKLFYHQDIISLLDERKKLLRELKQKQAQFVQKDQELKQKQAQLNQKNQELKQKQAQFVQKDQELKQKQAQLNQKNQELKQKQAQLNQKNQEINSLQNELMLIYNSKSWRLTRVLRKLKRFIK